MKGSYKFGIGLLIAVILAIAVIQASQKNPINWNKTYNPKDKIPFGTYIVRNELKNIFPNNQTVKPIEKSLYSYFNDSTESNQKQDLIFIGLGFSPGKAALKNLLDFVHQGNNTLISAKRIPQELKDTLKISTSTFNNYLAHTALNNDSVYFELTAGKPKALFQKGNNYQMFFDKLDSSTVHILGYLNRENIELPNFIRVKFGTGNFYIQLTPSIYSNYYMLKSKNYPIAYASLQNLKGEHLLWYDGLYNAELARTPLRVILSHPALRAAWYILLVTLLLFLIFKSKREQAAIPIVKPEKNLSVAFAETIGSLYYENGHPGNMINKKINYFLYNLKKDFRFEKVDISNPEFRKQAVLKLKLTKKEVDDFFDQIKYYQSFQNASTTELKSLQKLIEEFKQKIY